MHGDGSKHRGLLFKGTLLKGTLFKKTLFKGTLLKKTLLKEKYYHVVAASRKTSEDRHIEMTLPSGLMKRIKNGTAPKGCA